MTNLVGSTWVRKSDGTEVAVVQDRNAAARSLARPLRVKNIRTGKHSWTSPTRLQRRHYRSETPR